MYINYQPNDKDPKAKKGKSLYGDCAVRTICKAENLEWLEAYDLMSAYAREIQCPFNIKQGFEHILKRLGYEYHSIGKISRGKKRPTVKDFADNHKEGTFIPIVANHYVCIQDGDWYDTWDSGNCSIYGYWEKVR